MILFFLIQAHEVVQCVFGSFGSIIINRINVPDYTLQFLFIFEDSVGKFLYNIDVNV